MRVELLRRLSRLRRTGRAPADAYWNDIAHAYGAKDQRGVSIHRDGLIQKGVIWSPRRGQLDFTVPLFAEYLHENHPLAGFEDE